MKTARYSFLVAIVLVIGGYSAFWYYQASHIQKRLQDELNQLNGGGYGVTVQYDGMEKSGYPWDVEIGVLNPKIKASKSQIGEKEQAVEATVDGKIVDIFTVFGKRKGVELEGKTYLTFPEDGDIPACKLLLQGDISGKINSLVPADVRFILSDLTVFNVTTGKEVPKMDVDYASLDFRAKETRDMAHQIVQCGIDVQGLNTSNLFVSEDLMSRLQRIFSSKTGKINFHTNFEMELPGKKEIERIIESPAVLMIEKFPTVGFELDEYRLYDKYNSISGKAQFKIEEHHNKNVTLKAVFDTQVKTSDTYYHLLEESADQLKKEILAAPAPTQAQEQKQKEEVAYLDTFKANIPLIKRFNINDVAFNWEMHVNKNGADANIVLSKLLLANDSRAIDMHGEAKLHDKEASGELVVDLKNYRQMVQDVVDYYNHIAVPAMVFSGNDATWKSLPEGISQKITSYLKVISDSPGSESDDLKVTCKSIGGEIKVGTLTWKDFQEYTAHLTADILGKPEAEPVIQK